MRKRAIEIDAIIEYDRESIRYFANGSRTGTTARSLAELDSSLLRGKKIALVMSRRMTFTRSIPLPDASDRDLNMILRGKLGDVFPMPGNELSYAFIKTAQVSLDGRMCTVYAVRNDEVRKLLTSAKDFGFEISQIAPVSAIRPAEVLLTGQFIVVEPVPTGYGIDVYENGVHTSSRSLGSGVSIDQEIARVRNSDGPVTVLSTDPTVLDSKTMEGPLASLFATLGPAIDLEPEDVKAKKEQKRRSYSHRQAYLIFAAGFAVTALVVNDFISQGEAVDKKQKKANAQVEQLKKLKSIYETKVTELDPQAKQLKVAFHPAQNVSDIAFVISSLVPKGTWLTGMTIERGKLVTLRGTSKTPELIAAFVKSLGEQKRFRDVKLVQVSSGTIEASPVQQFTINAFPVGNLPAIDQGKKR